MSNPRRGRSHLPRLPPSSCYALGQSRITWAFFTVNGFIGIALFAFALVDLAARGCAPALNHSAAQRLMRQPRERAHSRAGLFSNSTPPRTPRPRTDVTRCDLPRPRALRDDV